ncbi:MAG: succinylglutamate desuccinylase/aspartoacylase family protein [Bacteroidia bacterium]|nr:succinylglutamate desuccinylase/aspartoacylase family protein [Bacteroidia bacterium]
MEINGASIAPGESQEVKINVGKLASGTRIHIYANVYRSAKKGPVLLVLGGVHGDEINGVEIVRRCVSDGVFENIQKGSVIAISLLNVYGFINFSREIPYGKDVNRSFPGTVSGSLASRVARVLTKKILPHVDCGVDYHTGGDSRYNFPQIRYTKGDPQAKELALAFGAPITLAKPAISKSLRKVSRDMGLTMLVYEGGEASRFDGFSINNGINGLKRLMKHLKMIKTDIPSLPTRQFIKTTWVRAHQAGIFTWTKSSGHLITKGEPLGYINDPNGQVSHKVLSKHDGFIIGHNNAPVVRQGDALFNIGIQ